MPHLHSSAKSTCKPRICTHPECGFGDVLQATRLRRTCCVAYYCSPACHILDQARHTPACGGLADVDGEAEAVSPLGALALEVEVEA